MWDIIFEIDTQNTVSFVSRLSVMILFACFLTGMVIKKIMQILTKV